MENDPMCGCNDAGCGWKGPARDLGCHIAQVEDFFERVAPGELVGECPECGALAHLLGNNETLRTLAQEMVLIAAQLTDNDANKMFALLAHKFSKWYRKSPTMAMVHQQGVAERGDEPGTVGLSPWPAPIM